MAKKVAKKVTKKRVKKNVERGQAHIGKCRRPGIQRFKEIYSVRSADGS